MQKVSGPDTMVYDNNRYIHSIVVMGSAFMQKVSGPDTMVYKNNRYSTL